MTAGTFTPAAELVDRTYLAGEVPVRYLCKGCGAQTPVGVGYVQTVPGPLPAADPTCVGVHAAELWHQPPAGGGDVAVCGWISPYIDRGQPGVMAGDGDPVTCPRCAAHNRARGVR